MLKYLPEYTAYFFEPPCIFSTLIYFEVVEARANAKINADDGITMKVKTTEHTTVQYLWQFIIHAGQKRLAN